MSHRILSRKGVADIAASRGWEDDDIVVAGTDAHDGPLHISRSQAAVPASLVRRWLLVKDGVGAARLHVVRDFVSADNCLFKPGAAPQRRRSRTAAARAPVQDPRPAA